MSGVMARLCQIEVTADDHGISLGGVLTAFGGAFHGIPSSSGAKVQILSRWLGLQEGLWMRDGAIYGQGYIQPGMSVEQATLCQHVTRSRRLLPSIVGGVAFVCEGACVRVGGGYQQIRTTMLLLVAQSEPDLLSAAQVQHTYLQSVYKLLQARETIRGGGV